MESGQGSEALLPEQSLKDLKPEELTPLSDVVMQRQATINIGTIGHVAHGKSTVVKAISGVQTVRFKNELERNITIKLGYANAKIYKCDNPKCPRPGNYRSFGSSKEAKPKCQQPNCNSTMTLQRHVSFVDCPGHDILMATMLNGAAVMDAALLLVAGNETCPQPQTSEHLAAVEIMKLKNIIILQNKIDLVKEKDAASQYEEILNFIRGTVADGAPIIPISAQLKYNIDVVCEYICKKIPVPVRDFTSSPQLIVIRSFDVNKPGEEVDNLKGGVAGGSILKGILKVGDEVEIRPGIITKDRNGLVKCTSIFSSIVSLFAEHNDLKFAVPGGLIGCGTRVDPTLTRADRLVGQVLGEVGALPDIFIELEISFFLLRRLLGVKTDGDKKKQGKIKKLAKGEVLMVNIGSTSTGARILQTKGDLAKVVLTSPVCSAEGEKLALSRRVEKHWRLIGWGKIRRGTKIVASTTLSAEDKVALDYDHNQRDADEGDEGEDDDLLDAEFDGAQLPEGEEEIDEGDDIEEPEEPKEKKRKEDKKEDKPKKKEDKKEEKEKDKKKEKKDEEEPKKEKKKEKKDEDEPKEKEKKKKDKEKEKKDDDEPKEKKAKKEKGDEEPKKEKKEKKEKKDEEEPKKEKKKEKKDEDEPKEKKKKEKKDEDEPKKEKKEKKDEDAPKEKKKKEKEENDDEKEEKEKKKKKKEGGDDEEKKEKKPKKEAGEEVKAEKPKKKKEEDDEKPKKEKKDEEPKKAKKEDKEEKPKKVAAEEPKKKEKKEKK